MFYRNRTAGNVLKTILLVLYCSYWCFTPGVVVLTPVCKYFAASMVLKALQCTAVDVQHNEYCRSCTAEYVWHVLL